MNELTNKDARTGLHIAGQLMNTAAVIVLLSTMPVMAADGDDRRPTVWIEVGGQLERFDGGQSDFSPGFTSSFAATGFTPVEQIERPSRYGNGFEGKVELDPIGSVWTFSAGIRYGRSNSQRKVHEETSPLPTYTGFVSVPAFHIHAPVYAHPASRRFSTVTSQTNEQSAVLDFQVGRDLGVGLFGSRSESQIDFGIRAVQFTASAKGAISANPDFHMTATTLSTYFGFPANGTAFNANFHLDNSSFNISRSFQGIGPSLAWRSSAVLSRPADDWSLDLDWGLNGALLFGRQKVTVQHQVSAASQSNQGAISSQNPVPDYQTAHATGRRHSVVVPNIGAFTGLSLRLPQAEISLGYRADFFFGAVDGGIDARKTYDRNFYGPFATISFGLGG